jgi:hypothetical protein
LRGITGHRAVVGPVTAATEGQAHVGVGLKNSHAGSEPEGYGKEDGERAPHRSI